MQGPQLKRKTSGTQSADLEAPTLYVSVAPYFTPTSPPNHDTMAKSSRSSVVKKNNQKLKKHVFGPIESARNERLNARLLELASQPKPARTGMEVERDGNSTPPQKSEHTPNDSVSAEGRDDTEAKDDQAGRSSSLSIPIPASLLHRNEQSQLPTPPSTYRPRC